MPRMWVRERGG